jgi:hypothetical protein
MTEFQTPDDLHRYISTTIQMLLDSDLSNASSRLQDINGTFFTSGTEWLGEVGLELRRIQNTYLLREELEERFELILEEIHTVWPDI